MSVITRTLDKKKKPADRYLTTLEELAEALHQEKCLIFLGAGASIDQDHPDLPTAKELSKALAQKCRLEWHEYIPLSTIAFYYEFFRSRDSLNSFLQEKIDDPVIKPTSTIEHLIQIIKVLEKNNKRIFVVTTNYDQHFERAYEKAFNRQPGVIIYTGGHDPGDKSAKLHQGLDKDPEFWLPQKPTYLYKMHGCISQPTEQNLVITEEDYINFLTNALSHDENKRILHFVRGRIALSTILFIGYSLSDWNFRVIFKATAEGKGTKSFAVQYYQPSDNNPTKQLKKTQWEALKEFWDKKNVKIMNLDASEFMEDLRKIVQEIK